MKVSTARKAARAADQAHTLGTLVADLPDRGERAALVAVPRKRDPETWSYARLAGEARRLARGLAEAGVRPGDTVGLWAENQPELIVASLATIAAGGVVVPIDAQLGGKVLRGVLEDSEVRFVFTTADQAERLEKLDAGPELRSVLLDAPEDDEQSWRRLLADEPAEVVQPSSADDTAVLFYTSGTTGPPKGVPLSHANVAFQLDAVAQANLVTEDDRVLLPLPLHHVYPFVIGMLVPMDLGLPIILPASLTGPQIARALRDGEASVVIGVPRLYAALYEGIQRKAASQGRLASTVFSASAGVSTFLRRRLGVRAGKALLRPLHKQFGTKLRVLACGGAPLDPELGWKLEGLGWQIAIGYGLTETSPLLTLNPPGGGHLESVGRTVPGAELRIDPSAVPEEGRPSRDAAGQPESGEIQARGPGVFRGYRHLPDKTDEAFTGDDWFRTGDLGYFDKQNYLHVLGRASTLIVLKGGENVQPDELEEFYAEHPLLREVGVLEQEGRLVALVMPDVNAVRRELDRSPRPPAAAEPSADQETTREREDGEEIESIVRNAIRERSRELPSYKRLAEFALTREPLPRTRLGKIQRHHLEDRYEKAKRGGEKAARPGPVPLEELPSEDRTLLQNEDVRQVWDWLAERYPDRRIAPDTSLQFDLGVDSMDWLNLTMEIAQRAGVELDDEAISEMETVRDLLQEVSEASETGAAGAGPGVFEDPESALSDRQKRWLEPLGPVRQGVARGGFAINRWMLRGLYRIRVTGRERLPERGPYVIVANHASHLDPFFLAATMDRRRLRDIFWAGWTGVAFRNPVARLVSRLSQIVPVDPQKGVISSLAFAVAVLRQGKSLVWFPEGQRSHTGELQAFRPGIGVLLERERVPVVPVFLHGTHDVLPPGRGLPRLRRPVAIVYGEPLDPAELARTGEGEQASDRIVHALEARMRALGREGP